MAYRNRTVTNDLKYSLKISLVQQRHTVRNKKLGKIISSLLITGDHESFLYLIRQLLTIADVCSYS